MAMRRTDDDNAKDLNVLSGAKGESGEEALFNVSKKDKKGIWKVIEAQHSSLLPSFVALTLMPGNSRVSHGVNCS